MEFIIKEASQQTADIVVDVLCAKISSEVYRLRQSGDQSLFDYKEAAEPRGCQVVFSMFLVRVIMSCLVYCHSERNLASGIIFIAFGWLSALG